MKLRISLWKLGWNIQTWFRCGYCICHRANVAALRELLLRKEKTSSKSCIFYLANVFKTVVLRLLYESSLFHNCTPAGHVLALPFCFFTHLSCLVLKYVLGSQRYQIEILHIRLYIECSVIPPIRLGNLNRMFIVIQIRDFPLASSHELALAICVLTPA